MKRRSQWAIGFEAGYICATANILKTHQDERVAKDVLLGIGNVDWDKISPFDTEPLREAGLIPPKPPAYAPGVCRICGLRPPGLPPGTTQGVCGACEKGESAP